MISICIPCYEMHGKGDIYLNMLLSSINSQCFKNYEVIISDQSISNIVKDVSDKYVNTMDLSYYKCDKIGKSSYNLNNAIIKAKYEIIKPMFQDDFFIDNQALSMIQSCSGCTFGGFGFTHYDEVGAHIGNTLSPYYNNDMKKGINTIGSPSVIFFKNDNNYFNNDLVWLMDCEFYVRMIKKYSNFQTINKCCIGIRLWNNSYTNNINHKIRNNEYLIVDKIHA